MMMMMMMMMRLTKAMGPECGLLPRQLAVCIHILEVTPVTSPVWGANDRLNLVPTCTTYNIGCGAGCGNTTACEPAMLVCLLGIAFANTAEQPHHHMSAADTSLASGARPATSSNCNTSTVRVTTIRPRICDSNPVKLSSEGSCSCPDKHLGQHSIPPDHRLTTTQAAVHLPTCIQSACLIDHRNRTGHEVPVTYHKCDITCCHAMFDCLCGSVEHHGPACRLYE
jgi:hypothetical protein